MRDDMGFVLDHKAPGRPDNENVSITTQGVPQFGAYPIYVISSVNGQADTVLQFQNGTIKDVGINGITNEALLAVVIDRLRDFQTGDYPCRENAIALTNIEHGLLWLQKRTTDRTLRGVEGEHKK